MKDCTPSNLREAQWEILLNTDDDFALSSLISHAIQSTPQGASLALNSNGAEGKVDGFGSRSDHKLLVKLVVATSLGGDSAHACIF